MKRPSTARRLPSNRWLLSVWKQVSSRSGCRTNGSAFLRIHEEQERPKAERTTPVSRPLKQSRSIAPFPGHRNVNDGALRAVPQKAPMGYQPGLRRIRQSTGAGHPSFQSRGESMRQLSRHAVSRARRQVPTQRGRRQARTTNPDFRVHSALGPGQPVG